MSIEYTNVRTYIHGVTHNIMLWAMTAMECGQWPSYVTYLLELLIKSPTSKFQKNVPK